jgi:thiol-disulfide isomerase/thioredoxin
MNRHLVWVFALAILVIAIGCGGGETSSSAKAGSSDNVLNFSLNDLEGKPIDLSQYTGKVVILDVWDTWCPPCRKGIPEFVDLYKNYKDQGLQIVGVALARNGVPTVQKFVSDYKINYLTVIGDKKIYDIFGEIRGIPTTFVIDKTGKIHQKYVGYHPKSVFEKDIKQLLAS